MAKFNDMIITNVGKTIYAKAIAGQTIEFTKAVVGNGKPANPAETETLTNVVSPRLNASIEIDTTSRTGIAIVNASVDNRTLGEDIEICELGLFCKDPDTNKEVLYSYTYAPNSSDVIPSVNSGEMIWRVQLLVYIENATGGGSGQSSTTSFTPTVAATVADGSTVNNFISDISANVQYVISGSLLTAFYNVTGVLSNMESAASGLSSVSISLPRSSAVECAVIGRMLVIDSNDEQIIVDVTGVIASGGSAIVLDYLGAQDGDFSLLLTVQYLI